MAPSATSSGAPKAISIFLVLVGGAAVASAPSATVVTLAPRPCFLWIRPWCWCLRRAETVVATQFGVDPYRCDYAARRGARADAAAGSPTGKPQCKATTGMRIGTGRTMRCRRVTLLLHDGIAIYCAKIFCCPCSLEVLYMLAYNFPLHRRSKPSTSLPCLIQRQR